MNIYKSQEPCFVCEKAGRNVQIREKDLSVVLCLEHAYKHIPEKENPSEPKKGRKKKEPQETVEAVVQ